MFITQGPISGIYKELQKLSTEEMKQPINKLASELSRQLKNKKKVTQMASNYFKECSVSLAIREMQIKATVNKSNKN